MRVLVTGVDGFIGSHVAEHLKANGHEVLGFCRTKPEIDLDYFLIGDLRENDVAERLKVVLKKVDSIQHIAANADVWDPHPDLFHTNIHGTWELLDYARWSDASFVFTSSSAVYGNTPAPNKEDGPTNPNNNYALTKLVMEKMIESYSKVFGLKGVALRYFNTYGTREHTKGKTASIPYQFLRQAMGGKISIYGDGKQKRDFICVKDTVRANAMAMVKAKGFEIINMGSGTAIEFNDVANMAQQIVSNGTTIEHVDNPLKNGYQLYTQADMSKAKEKLDFVPQVSLNEGMKWMHDYYSRNTLL